MEGFDIPYTLHLIILQFVFHCNTTYNFTYIFLSFLNIYPWRWKAMY